MSSHPAKPTRSTIEQYLLLEASAQTRHEYRDGQIIAMAGGSPEHSLIIANIIRELGNRLKGSTCRVYDSNLRIRVPRTPLYTYPDATVICGEIQFDPHDAKRTTAANPRVIIEVLSASTEADDRGEKFRRYLSLESLQEYVLVSQVRPWVETFTRLPDGARRFATASGLDANVTLSTLQLHLPLSEIYANLQLPPDDEQPASS